MKTIKFLKIIVVAILTLTIASCVDGDQYDVPAEADAAFNPATSIEAQINDGTLSTITIAELKDLMVSGDVNQITSDMVVMGYVVSSDETGNFYQDFYMQDAPSNPTAAIKVVLSNRDNYITYNIGRKMYIKLKDLYIGETRSGNGVVAIGGKTHVDNNGNGVVDAMTSNQAPMHLYRTNVVETIVPLELTLQEISASHIGMFVTAVGVEFPSSLEGKSYVDPTDQYDTQRTMQSCGGFNYATFLLKTSAFASFKDVILPNMNGNISGIITKTYNGSDLVMTINTPNDVIMNNARCELLDINDFTVLLEEDFDTSTNYQDLDTTGWTNFAEAGSRVWRERVYQGNGYAELSAFNANDNSNIAWLVSPAIDMDSAANEYLSFKTAQHHLDSADNTLEVLISTDFDGTDIMAATWSPITANTASIGDSWYTFIESGLVDLSSYTGNVYIAFKYTGAGNDNQLDGAYMVDDFLVLAN